jgi:hypothetical protein
MAAVACTRCASQGHLQAVYAAVTAWSAGLSLPSGEAHRWQGTLLLVDATRLAGEAWGRA